MSRTCKHTPELHSTVIAFLKLINELHQQNGGEFSLADFVDTLSPKLATQFQQRALTKIVRTSSERGTFLNEGDAQTIVHGLLKIEVPNVICGSYICFENSVSFLFEKQHTVSGKALFFKTDLLEVDANQYKLDIDLTGDSFDQCFVHAELRQGI